MVCSMYVGSTLDMTFTLCVVWCSTQVLYEALVSSLPQETHTKLIFNIKETTLVHYSTLHYTLGAAGATRNPTRNAMLRIHCLT